MEFSTLISAVINLTIPQPQTKIICRHTGLPCCFFTLLLLLSLTALVILHEFAAVSRIC